MKIIIQTNHGKTIEVFENVEKIRYDSEEHEELLVDIFSAVDRGTIGEVQLWSKYSQTNCDRYTTVPFSDAIEIDDWELCEMYLHHGGSRSTCLNLDDHLDVFSRGDGYGKMTGEKLLEQGLDWDWSHIRDSSDDAITEMAYRIRELVVPADVWKDII